MAPRGASLAGVTVRIHEALPEQLFIVVDPESDDEVRLLLGRPSMDAARVFETWIVERPELAKLVDHAKALAPRGIETNVGVDELLSALDEALVIQLRRGESKPIFAWQVTAVRAIMFAIRIQSRQPLRALVDEAADLAGIENWVGHAFAQGAEDITGRPFPPDA